MSKTKKRLLGVSFAVILFLGILSAITFTDSGQTTDAIVEPSFVQQGGQALLDYNIFDEEQLEAQQQAAGELALSAELSDFAWQLSSSTASAISFSDVKESDWFYKEVMWAINNGITDGISSTQFGPLISCKNAQVLTFIWRASGKPVSTINNPFSDVPVDSYYYQPALWAYEKGIVSGPVLSPDKDCTRAMAVEYLWKAAGAPDTTASAQFADVLPSSSVSQAVAWAVNNGITTGVTNTTFEPDTVCNRAQIVTFLYRNNIYQGTSNETLTLPSGISYYGETANGVPHGTGTLVIPTVGQYTGKFQSGQRSGDGSFSWSTGETYTGAWRDDRISGEGTLTLNSGWILKGTFSNGNLISGTYIATQDFGTLEISYVKDSAKAPAVKLSLLDGSIYSGPVINGKLNGDCTITFGNGDQFAGSIIDNLKAGMGTYTWKDGARYIGSWSGDKMSGTGTYYYTGATAGERLLGQFSDNVPYGTCTYFSASNTSYRTTWANGRCVSVARG